MCGHATIALGLFLVDSDNEAYPSLLHNDSLRLDERTMTVTIRLHCPCGIVRVTVPVVTALPDLRCRSCPNRPVSFISVDSYATGIDVEATIPEGKRWPELGNRGRLTVDFAYSGAFYYIADATELGFDGIKSPDLSALSRASAMLKDALTADSKYAPFFKHATDATLGTLYGIIVRDSYQSALEEGVDGAELGIRFFANQQVDQSPCGSGSAARRALAHAKHKWPMGSKCTYHSIISDASGGLGGFTASVVEESPDQRNVAGRVGESVRILVEGRAFYTGFSSFVMEPADRISGAGFLI
ncbi:hypothetical protein B0T14DRAFT_566039 [Immersiella caudata]|uniref:trans-L-3-hydroxyproline dehydratase n=1 Tax=Immersiella caudata TaxID=314043 RepID=A0AA39WPE5_9PEZI|nr:hypothetical protein B0T14DRAFT_566039 [Immersiella caudata]